jgi:hypothetical protein
MCYPIIIKASPRLVQEFQECEEARYEDKGVAIANGDTDWPESVGWEILDRRKRDIEIRTEQELREIRWAIGSGTTTLFSWGMYRAAMCLIKRLEDIAPQLGVEFTRLESTWPETPEHAIGEKSYGA